MQSSTKWGYQPVSKLICPACKTHGMTWLEEDVNLDTTIAECDNPECKARFKGIPGIQSGIREDFTFEHGHCEKHGIPHRMRRWNCYSTTCLNPGCKEKI